MIIFYSKKTGEIVGTVNGRINLPEELNMWIGDKKEINRLVVQWKPYQFLDEKGKKVNKNKLEKGKSYNADFEPDHPQKDIFIKLDKTSSDIHKYKIDLKTKNLIAK